MCNRKLLSLIVFAGTYFSPIVVKELPVIMKESGDRIADLGSIVEHSNHT